MTTYLDLLCVCIVRRAEGYCWAIKCLLHRDVCSEYNRYPLISQAEYTWKVPRAIIHTLAEKETIKVNKIFCD